MRSLLLLVCLTALALGFVLTAPEAKPQHGPTAWKRCLACHVITEKVR